MTELPVHIRAAGRRATVEVDGRDVSHLLTGAVVTLNAHELPTVELGLIATTTTDVELAAADIGVGSETRDLLIGLGWDPPVELTAQHEVRREWGIRWPNGDVVRCADEGLARRAADPVDGEPPVQVVSRVVAHIPWTADQDQAAADVAAELGRTP